MSGVKSAVSRKEYFAAYKNANRGRILAQSKAYHIRNAEKEKLWKKTNKEKVRAYRKTSEQRNKEKRAAYRRSYVKQRYAQDPEFRIGITLRSRLTKIIRSSKRLKTGAFSDLVGCSAIELRQHIESLWTEGMSWGNYGPTGWHIDHKLPCALFDLSDPLHQRACFHYTNLRPLWSADNCAKGALVEFEPSAVPALLTDVQITVERQRVAEHLGSDAWKKINAMEAELEQLEQTKIVQNHVFTPGMYVREVFLPKGTLVTTRIHLTEHPFVISSGVVSVWSEENGVVTLRAPHTGVTKAGTRRILFIHEDCIWSTFHPNPKGLTNPDAIVREVTFSEGKFADLGIAAKNAAAPQLAEGVA